MNFLNETSVFMQSMTKAPAAVLGLFVVKWNKVKCCKQIKRSLQPA